MVLDQLSLTRRMKATPPAVMTIMTPPTVSVPIGDVKKSANLPSAACSSGEGEAEFSGCGPGVLEGTGGGKDCADGDCSGWSDGEDSGWDGSMEGSTAWVAVASGAGSPGAGGTARVAAGFDDAPGGFSVTCEAGVVAEGTEGSCAAAAGADVEWGEPCALGGEIVVADIAGA
ncbi:MAG: hypothetical protein FWF25_08065 [Propionibacteriaceae bacterium]|nr:hypothetical protein [Propionibacteriaceae bacterium]